MRAQVRATDAALTAQKAELTKLHAIIGEADAERARQQKEHAVVLNERDILGVHLKHMLLSGLILTKLCVVGCWRGTAARGTRRRAQ